MNNRRDKVPFDARFFEKRSREEGAPSRREAFRYILEHNHWSGAESVSGEGASRRQTRIIEARLPQLLRELGVDTLLDLPCGDFSWMRFVDLSVRQYIGADLLPELIEANNKQHADEKHHFVTLDLTADPLPEADLLLCRDCLVHLSFEDIHAALENIRSSPITYLLTTTFPECEENEDIVTGDWRVLNLERPPFNFPAPLRLINEGCTEARGAFRDKNLGLWRVENMNL